MYQIQYDRTQVASVVGMLAAIHEMNTGETYPLDELQSQTQSIVELLEQAVDQFTSETKPYEVNIGPVVAVVWPIPASERGKSPHTHEVSLYVNPAAYLRDLGIPAYDVITSRLPENHPGRNRFLHVRRYVTHTYGGILLGEELQLKGGFTVCFKDNLDGTLSYAIAKCHDKDHYVKKIGRNQSSSRLARGESKTVTMSINEFRDWILSEITAGRWK